MVAVVLSCGFSDFLKILAGGFLVLTPQRGRPRLLLMDFVPCWMTSNSTPMSIAVGHVQMIFAE
jgi:hypothetical protein